MEGGREVYMLLLMSSRWIPSWLYRVMMSKVALAILIEISGTYTQVTIQWKWIVNVKLQILRSIYKGKENSGCIITLKAPPLLLSGSSTCIQAYTRTNQVKEELCLYQHKFDRSLGFIGVIRVIWVTFSSPVPGRIASRCAPVIRHICVYYIIHHTSNPKKSVCFLLN